MRVEQCISNSFENLLLFITDNSIIIITLIYKILSTPSMFLKDKLFSKYVTYNLYA